MGPQMDADESRFPFHICVYLRSSAVSYFGMRFDLVLASQTKGDSMGREDIAAGKAKQVKGKINDVVGAVKGDSGQQVKGKIQKGIGKVQEALGKDSTKNK
jgi:uncharacterized protein YjbJ (UPF0337 family)